MRDEYDAIVVGGGVMGTSAARWLTRRRRHTLLLERFEIGNLRGSSGGRTRLFRLAYPHPDYVRLARRALEEWRALEAEAGSNLLVTTGGLDLGAGGRISARALEAASEPFAYLPAEAVRERWPSLRPPERGEIFVQEDAGVCLAEPTIREQARLAVEGGATVLEGTVVDRIVPTGTGAEVHTPGDTYRAPIVVVTAGPWAGELLAASGVPLPLVPTLEQVTHFALEEPGPLPTVTDWDADPPGIPYAVPDPVEQGRFKVAFHRSGPPVHPDERSFDPDPDRVRRATEFAAERFAPHRAAGSETCLYTNTPDEDFVLDRRGPVVIGSPCSGHGFKFAPLLGRILADLAMARPAPLPIERFLSARFAT